MKTHKIQVNRAKELKGAGMTRIARTNGQSHQKEAGQMIKKEEGPMIKKEEGQMIKKETGQMRKKIATLALAGALMVGSLPLFGGMAHGDDNYGEQTQAVRAVHNSVVAESYGLRYPEGFQGAFVGPNWVAEAGPVRTLSHIVSVPKGFHGSFLGPNHISKAAVSSASRVTAGSPGLQLLYAQETWYTGGILFEKSDAYQGRFQAGRYLFDEWLQTGGEILR